MAQTLLDIGIASQIGAYSDAVLGGPSERWLITSGTPGLSTTGELPDDITGQAELAWQHIVGMLERSGMRIENVVKLTQYLTHAEDIRPYTIVRNRFLGETRPASTLLLTPQLVRPEFLVEVEVMAARSA